MWGFRVALSSAVDEAHQEITRQFEELLPEVRAKYAAQMEKQPDDAQVPYDWAVWLLSLHRGQMEIDFAEVEEMLTQTLGLVDKQSSDSFGCNREEFMDNIPLAHVYYNRAATHNELQNYDALADITEAIELDRSDADAFMLRAGIACNMEHWAQAEKDLSTALKLKPKHLSELKIRARIRVGRGEWQAALEMLTELIKQPLFTPLWQLRVYLWQAEVFEQLGKPDRAMGDYYHYYLWRPEAPEAKELVHKMREYLEQK